MKALLQTSGVDGQLSVNVETLPPVGARIDIDGSSMVVSRIQWQVKKMDLVPVIILGNPRKAQSKSELRAAVID